MRVLVAGATGAIGRPLVRRLVAAGHQVTGMTRSPERGGALRELGADVAVADALDAEAVGRAVAEAGPEVVVNELTAIPKRINPRRMKRDFAANDRLRVEGTANLVEAARAAGVGRLVSQSIAFAYAPVGGPVKDESDPLYLESGPPFGRTVRAVAELERQTLESAAIAGTVLRYGWFYGPGTAYAPDGAIAADVRRRRFPVVGSGAGLFSFVHIDDAAAATVLAIERGVEGTFNVVDDEPAAARDWLPAYAKALGAKPPRSAPAWMARIAAGRIAVEQLTELRGASNAAARRELGWEPALPTWREGFEHELAGRSLGG
jgi:nucleoside-diphosphate-sugar epimerase